MRPHSLGAVGPPETWAIWLRCLSITDTAPPPPQTDHFQLCGLVISKTDLRHPKLSHYLREAGEWPNLFSEQVNLKYFELKKIVFLLKYLT